MTRWEDARGAKNGIRLLSSRALGAEFFQQKPQPNQVVQGALFILHKKQGLWGLVDELFRRLNWTVYRSLHYFGFRYALGEPTQKLGPSFYRAE